MQVKFAGWHKDHGYITALKERLSRAAVVKCAFPMSKTDLKVEVGRTSVDIVFHCTLTLHGNYEGRISLTRNEVAQLAELLKVRSQEV